MYLLLSVLAICIMIIIVINSLQRHPITIIIHKKFETVNDVAQELSEEDKKVLDEQRQTIDGMNEVIKFAQEFLGGATDDAESEYETE